MLWRNLLLLASVTALDAQDWPMYLLDPTHSSFNARESVLNSTNVASLEPLWKTNFGATISTGVTISDGVLFFGAWDGNFYAVDVSNGNILWQQYLGKAPDPDSAFCGEGIGVGAQPTASGDIVYAAGGDSAVYALDRHTGNILWRVALADPQSGAFLWSSPLVTGNALYIGIASLTDCPPVRGAIVRISLSDPSQPLIRYLVPPDQIGAGVWSTPALDEQANLLYVTTGDAGAQDEAQGIWGSALLALDPDTLEIRAHFFLPFPPTDDDADWGSSPLLFETPDGSPFVAANGKTGVMYVLHRPDLSFAWSATLAIDCDSPESGCGSVSTPAFDGQTLFTGAGVSPLYPDYPDSYGSVYAFDPGGPTLLWSYASDGIVIAPVTVTPGVVYVPTTLGMVILDAATGAVLWRDFIADGLFGQAVVSTNVLYCTYRNGDVIAWGLPHHSAATSGRPAAPDTPPRMSPSRPSQSRGEVRAHSGRWDEDSGNVESRKR